MEEKNIKTWKSCEVLSFRHDMAGAPEHHLVISVCLHKTGTRSSQWKLERLGKGCYGLTPFSRTAQLLAGEGGSLSYGQLAVCPCPRSWPTSIQIWHVLTGLRVISNKDGSEDTKGPGGRVGN